MRYKILDRIQDFQVKSFHHAREYVIIPQGQADEGKSGKYRGTVPDNAGNLLWQA